VDFDYIIVGSGAGGSVLAERLSADPTVRVLVVEAGGPDGHPVHRVPKGFFFTMHSPRYARKFTTNPFGPDGVTDTWARGRVVGGSTTVNGLIWNRGWAPDYDKLEADGNPGWGWSTFLDAFKRLENFQLGGSAIHGSGGPVGVELARPAEPVSEVFMESCEQLGMERVLDLNGSDGERTGYTQFSTWRGMRVSAARAFLHPALRRANLTLLTRAEVGTVLFDGKRAAGVRLRHDGSVADYRARREVILCAGALETPLLLERSGIGRGDVLGGAGVRQLVESPNVGERMSEHRGLRLMYRLSGADGYNSLVSTQLRQLLTGAKYLVTRSGIISQGSANVLTYFRADKESERHDTIGFFNPISTKNTSLHNKALVVDDQPGLMLSLYPTRPTSRGSIHIGGSEPEDAPRIDPNFLTTEHDQRLIRLAAEKGLELFSTGPIAKHVTDRLYPPPAVTSPDDFAANALSAGASGYHTLGTCAMGPGEDDVVDAQLRVRGVEALRVVDASVFPYQPSGNTSAPTQALAWHAALLIRAAHN
jgi:choline dehydrogenase-like flavoprotein